LGKSGLVSGDCPPRAHGEIAPGPFEAMLGGESSIRAVIDL